MRREVGLALELGKPIVMVLVEGQPLPPPETLPEALRDVTRMQGIPFYPEYSEAAVARLADFLTKVTTVAPTPSLAAIRFRGGTRPPPSTRTPWQTFQEALGLLEAGDYDKAIFLLETLEAAGFQLRHHSIEALLAEARAQQAAEALQQAAQAEYEEILLLAGSRFTEPAARAAWASFQTAYPNFPDAGKLAERSAAPGPSPTPSRASGPSPADSHCGAAGPPGYHVGPAAPPPERAEAGRRLAELGDPRPGVGLRADGCRISRGCGLRGGGTDWGGWGSPPEPTRAEGGA